MDVIRQDAWTKDEDTLLARTVLQFITEGRTQLEAFKQVGKQLSRTAGACAFRWNATVRKTYHDEIEQAKIVRKKPVELNKKGNISTVQQQDQTLDLTQLINLLRELNDTKDSPKHKTINKLSKENKQLKKTLGNYKAAIAEIEKILQWMKKN